MLINKLDNVEVNIEDGHKYARVDIKKGENAEKTIPREIKEELNLDVVKAKYMSSRYHAKKEVEY